MYRAPGGGGGWGVFLNIYIEHDLFWSFEIRCMATEILVKNLSETKASYVPQQRQGNLCTEYVFLFLSRKNNLLSKQKSAKKIGLNFGRNIHFFCFVL
jgi:hypothetical protein